MSPRLDTRRRRLLVLAALIAFGWIWLSALPASAHATLELTVPQQGSQLAQAPRQVAMTFSEGVGLSSRSLQVLDGAGYRVDRGAPRHDSGDQTISIALQDGLPSGSYAVVWRVVSADSHPVSGTFSFGVGVPAGAVSMTTPAAGPGAGALRPLRIPVFTAASVGLGVVAHLGAGGSPPAPGATILIVLTVALAALVLGQCEQRLPALATAMLAVQLGTHIALMRRWDALPGHDATAHGAREVAAHQLLGGSAPMADPNSPRMLLAHALTALALAWWLRRGEALIWRAALAVLPGSWLLSPPLVPDTEPTVCAGFARLVVRCSRWLGPASGVRGSPQPA